MGKVIFLKRETDRSSTLTLGNQTVKAHCEGAIPGSIIEYNNKDYFPEYNPVKYWNNQEVLNEIKEKEKELEILKSFIGKLDQIKE